MNNLHNKKLETIKDDLALILKGYFIRWREQFPNEDKDVDELPLQNARNIINLLLKKYNEAYDTLREQGEEE
jgi:hypothetical protein